MIRVLGGFAALALLAFATPSASAYTLGSAEWCGAHPDTPVNVYVWNNAGSHTYAADLGWRIWAASPTPVKFQQGGSSLYAVDITTAFFNTGWAGLTTMPASGCLSTGLHVDGNTKYLAVWSFEHVINTFAHEMGHVQGLAHSEKYDALMCCNTVNNFNDRPFLGPVRDDIQGVTAQYLNAPSRSTWPVSSFNGGSVTRDAAGFPSSIAVTTAGTGKYAMASTGDLGVPSAVNVIVVQALLTPQPLYRTSACVCDTTNPASPTTRMYDVEINNDKFALTYTNSANGLGVIPLTINGSTPVPQPGFVYWVTLHIYDRGNNGTPCAVAYVQRSSGTHVAHTSWTCNTKYRLDGTSYAMGAGVWTDSSSNPASAATVGQAWSGVY